MSKNKPLHQQPTLEVRWQKAFASTPPSLARSLAESLLAYREQEQAEGGLSRHALRALEAVHVDSADGKGKSATPRYKSGVRLMRTWQGRSYVATIAPHGYLFEGREYASLSKIAKEITGTTWSGPAFFGVKKRTGKEPA